MQRLKILVTIKSNNQSMIYQTEATYDQEKNYLYYLEKDSDKTAVIYDYKKNILKRDNLKIYQEFKFISRKITINKMLLKDLDKYIDIEISTTKIINNYPELTVYYSLNEEKYLYKIEIMEELK